MANERVSIREGKTPILVVAPHGPDDLYTIEIANQIAEITDGYAVINRGWVKSQTVDSNLDLGNCNNVSQLVTDDVLKDEFLNPILRFKKRCITKFKKMYMFTIHGCKGFNIDLYDEYASTMLGVSIYNKYDIHYVIGYGCGKPNRFCCDPRLKDILICELNNRFMAVSAGIGHKYAGWSQDNLIQIFNQPIAVSIKNKVQSIQIEISSTLRQNQNQAKEVGKYMAEKINRVTKIDIKDWEQPENIDILQL